MFDRISDSTKHVYWNATEGCYVAFMSDVPSCLAEGSTPSEALTNVGVAYAELKRTYVESLPRSFPPPRPAGFGR